MNNTIKPKPFITIANQLEEYFLTIPVEDDIKHIVKCFSTGLTHTLESKEQFLFLELLHCKSSPDNALQMRAYYVKLSILIQSIHRHIQYDICEDEVANYMMILLPHEDSRELYIDILEAITPYLCAYSKDPERIRRSIHMALKMQSPYDIPDYEKTLLEAAHNTSISYWHLSLEYFASFQQQSQYVDRLIRIAQYALEHAQLSDSVRERLHTSIDAIQK